MFLSKAGSYFYVLNEKGLNIRRADNYKVIISFSESEVKPIQSFSFFKMPQAKDIICDNFEADLISFFKNATNEKTLTWLPPFVFMNAKLLGRAFDGLERYYGKEAKSLILSEKYDKNLIISYLFELKEKCCSLIKGKVDALVKTYGQKAIQLVHDEWRYQSDSWIKNRLGLLREARNLLKQRGQRSVLDMAAQDDKLNEKQKEILRDIVEYNRVEIKSYSKRKKNEDI